MTTIKLALVHPPSDLSSAVIDSPRVETVSQCQALLEEIEFRPDSREHGCWKGVGKAKRDEVPRAMLMPVREVGAVPLLNRCGCLP